MTDASRQYPVQRSDDEWRETFAVMVDPLQALTRAVLPQMIARKAGKILLMGSASALRADTTTCAPRACRNL